MGDCWACRYEFPAAAIFFDANGDPWPLCASHLEIWLASSPKCTEVTGSRYTTLDSLIAEESARGIAEIENMLRGQA